MTVRNSDTGEETSEATLHGVCALRRRLAQIGETMIIAGPADDDLALLRENGYRPETPEAMAASRLAWETVYMGMLGDSPRISARELRVRVMARELSHEHFDLLDELLSEYHLTLAQVLGIGLAQADSDRARSMEFADRIPTMRLAADMKTALFRNAERRWTLNDLCDIDALSLAIPYCHVVVTDKDAADRVRRSKGDERHGTAVLSTFDPLLDRLPDLIAKAKTLGGDPTGWHVSGPGEGFVTTPLYGSWSSTQPSSATAGAAEGESDLLDAHLGQG